MRLLNSTKANEIRSFLGFHSAIPFCRAASYYSSVSSPSLEITSVYFPSRDGEHRLHTKRIRQANALPGTASSPRPVCLLFHGALSDGRVFYSVKSQRGLGCYLARMGNCDVFVADFRGRGLSRPPVSSLSNYGQHELIIDDVRAFSDGVAALLAREKGEEGNEGHTHSARQHWLAHSWGGIILSSALARYPSYASSVASQVWFGAKRVISVKSWEKVFKIDLVWGLLFPLLGKIYGFIPARRFKLGADDESLPFLSECSLWVRGGRWVDAKDGFDYAAGAQSMSNYPPTLSLAGEGDRILGNPHDVLSFLKEHESQAPCPSSPTTVPPPFQFRVLSKRGGHKHDYDHSSFLLHRDCETDHFPLVLEWIRKHSESN